MSDLDMSTLPEIVNNLLFLIELNLDYKVEDLSILNELFGSEDSSVEFAGIYSLPRRYWTKPSEWKSEWLLDENNAEIRRVLVERIGYDRICADLDAVVLDTWREYTLLEIDGIEAVYEYRGAEQPIDREPMVLLKMTCPSTGHIHILRVPPEMDSAEEAITWVNHDLHPDRFAVQT